MPSWGPAGRWESWFSRGVLEGVVGLVRGHREGRLPSMFRGAPAVIGCVPWVTDSDVVDELAMLPGGCCLVIGKGANNPAPARRLQATGTAISKGYFRELDELTPTANYWVGPGEPWPVAGDHDLGPVRVAGHAPAGRRWPPLIHAKVLVFGRLVWFERDWETGDGDRGLFDAQSMWWGSANLTHNARGHVEVGFWCDDRSLVVDAYRFVVDLIGQSEPLTSTSLVPLPELVSWEYDNDAMAQAYDAYLENEADDLER